jgi:tetratricopeptide (TPR) repeat protein
VLCTSCGERIDVPQDRWIVTTPIGDELVFASLEDLKKAVLEDKITEPAPEFAPSSANVPASQAVSDSNPPISIRDTDIIEEVARQMPLVSMTGPPPPLPSKKPEPPPEVNRADERILVDELSDPGRPGSSRALRAARRHLDSIRLAPPQVDGRAPEGEKPKLPPPDINPLGEPPLPPPDIDPTIPSLESANLVEVATPAESSKSRTAKPDFDDDKTPLPLHPVPKRASDGAVTATKPRRPETSEDASFKRIPLDGEAKQKKAMVLAESDEARDSEVKTEPMIPRAESPARTLSAAAAQPQAKRGGMGMLLFILVCIAGTGYLIMTQLKPTDASAVSPASSVRPDLLMIDGEVALSEGNFDGAQDFFDRAATVDRSPRVLIDLAKLAGARADVAWLKVRLVPPSEAAQAQAALAPLSAKARDAANNAHTSAPNDPVAIRAKVDALRIAGEIDDAQGLVPKIMQITSEPATAYVLAALELARLPTTAPSPPVADGTIEKLRVAAADEGSMGRARATLVYALARSGDRAGAKAELDKLGKLARPHPLFGALSSYLTGPPVALVTSAVPSGVRQGSAVESPVSAAPPGTGRLTLAPPASAAVRITPEPPMDHSVVMQRAASARRAGDYAKARELYQAAIAKNALDTEALSGLAETARAQGDRAEATDLYKRALSSNSSYFPAVIGLADTLWEAGDKAGAVAKYKDIVERFPPSMVPERAKQRAAGE